MIGGHGVPSLVLPQLNLRSVLPEVLPEPDQAERKHQAIPAPPPGIPSTLASPEISLGTAKEGKSPDHPQQNEQNEATTTLWKVSRARSASLQSVQGPPTPSRPSTLKLVSQSGVTNASTMVTANDLLERIFGEPLPEGEVASSFRLIRIILGGLCSSFVAGSFSAFALIISGIWAVPGHKDASFLDGLMNRLVWSISPCFLGSFFPGIGHPDLMRDWRSHRFFVLVSLVPFIIADVLFPYVVGTDTDFKVFFSTCFWPTTTCIFFLPSMVAGIRRIRGDPEWQQISSQIAYIIQEGSDFRQDFGRLLVCFIAVVAPVNYIALDFAVVLPNLDRNKAAILRPVISMCLKLACTTAFKFAASNLSAWFHIYGLFPLALNTGLHNAMAVLLCQDWLSVIVWIACDYLIIFWRTRRLRSRGMKCCKSLTYLPWLSEDDFVRRKGFEAITMGWGLTAALSSLLMVSPFMWFLPSMLQRFLFPQGVTSASYLATVCFADILADMISLTYLTRVCKCDYGHLLAHPFSKPLRGAYLATLSVVWAPCAIGCFGWVFQHMCVAAFEDQCWSAFVV